jgi:Protein of unknown function (DUF2975)
MTNTAWLPKVLRWLFAVMSIASGILAIALIILLVIDPKLPFDHLGPYHVDISGQPGTVSMLDSNFLVSAFHGAVVVRMMDASGLIELLKHYGLPLIILNAVFFAVLFDLMRRMFRNVGRGESFTQATVKLVQIIGVSLLVFSLVAAAAESWFHYALFTYLAQHAVITISGASIHLPSPQGFTISSGGPFPFGSPVFFTGLLVLALSEVFRQGLVLKRENDLTV